MNAKFVHVWRLAEKTFGRKNNSREASGESVCVWSRLNVTARMTARNRTHKDAVRNAHSKQLLAAATFACAIAGLLRFLSTNSPAKVCIPLLRVRHQAPPLRLLRKICSTRQIHQSVRDHLC